MIARGDETTHYNGVLRSNFIFSFLFRSMELQLNMLGFFNGPLNSRCNNQVPTTSHFTRYWMRDWSWIRNLTCSLDTWVQSLSEESNNRFLAFLTGYKHAMEHYKRLARLDDIRYWLDELDDSQTYVRHLQIYATGQNMLFFNNIQCFTTFVEAIAGRSSWPGQTFANHHIKVRSNGYFKMRLLTN